MLTTELPPTPPKRNAYQVQRAVLVALVIRELRARVQGRWLGMLWMLFEPLAHVLAVLALFNFRRNAVTLNIEFPVFLVTGMLPFFVFRNLARQVPTAISANRQLFAYRQVLPIDALAARAIVEIGLYGAVYVCALAILGWLGYHCVPRAPLELVGTIALFVLLGLGLGLILAVASHRRPRVTTFINLVFFPLYFLSGVIFPLHSLSPDVRDMLLWNPVLHLVELARYNFIPNYTILPGASAAYPAIFALGTLAFGMSAYRVYRHQFIAVA